MSVQDVSVLEQCLWPKGARRDIWMIVDAARDRRIFGMLLDGFYSDHTCLFSGPLTPVLEVAAPYLVRLEYKNAKTQRFMANAWGNNWGVFLRSDMGRTELRRHLRELLLVHDSRGDRMFFRYYDPRVLRVYLPTCTWDELRTVFGGIECFWMEDERPATMLSAGLDQTRLIIQEIPLQQ